MRYESTKTAKGNIGISYMSQELADKQAQEMDRHNCRNCTYCSNCSNCTYCSNCTNCRNCSNCSNCSNCRNCTYCTYCSNCSNCRNCSNCSNCRNCSNCSNCRNCIGSLKWNGPEVKALTSLNGLLWPISVSETHMQIGCQNHSHEAWEKFSDGRIFAMHSSALEFWQQWKPTLMAMCKWKASCATPS